MGRCVERLGCGVQGRRYIAQSCLGYHPLIEYYAGELKLLLRPASFCYVSLDIGKSYREHPHIIDFEQPSSRKIWTRLAGYDM